MGYKLLGMAVWKGTKLYLRRRYGTPPSSKPLVAGGLLVAAVGLLLLAKSRDSSA
jgi:hypothetical protein